MGCRNLCAYVITTGWFDAAKEATIREEERAMVLKALETAEAKKKPSVDMLFDDVYETKTAHLLRQERELQAHMAKYPEHYADGAH